VLSAAVLASSLPASAETTVPVLSAVSLKPLPGAVEVSWTASGPAEHWRVLIVSDGRFMGQRTYSGSTRKAVVGHMPPGTTVQVSVGSFTADGTYNTWLTSSTVKVPRDASCPATNGTCVHVDARTSTGPATGTGLGMLHGITANTDPARVDSLDLRHWRISAFDEARFRLAQQAGGSITVALSDPWSWYNRLPDGRITAPWADWDYYRWWTSTIVQWHVDQGIVPDRWEVQNEPKVEELDAAHPPTQDLIVEQHAVATEAVRAVLPDAKIVGPSMWPFQIGSGLVDFEAFATKSAARGLDLDGVTIHDILGACGSCDGGPAATRQHIDDAKAALTSAGLGSLPIDVTEFAAPYEQLQPGAILGYLSAFADTGVRYAGTSCWDRADGLQSGCFAPGGTLDGLLMPDGRTPTDAWWTYEAYARLSGAGAQLTRTTVDDPATSAVASVTGGVVRTLIGRHQGCTTADGPCPNGTAPGRVENINVRMSLPTTGKWAVVVTKLASTTGGSTGPKVALSKTFSATSSPLNLGSFPVADGEVLQVVATRR
jgi:hypothetical protein